MTSEPIRDPRGDHLLTPPGSGLPGAAAPSYNLVQLGRSDVAQDPGTVRAVLTASGESPHLRPASKFSPRHALESAGRRFHPARTPKPARGWIEVAATFTQPARLSTTSPRDPGPGLSWSGLTGGRPARWSGRPDRRAAGAPARSGCRRCRRASAAAGGAGRCSTPGLRPRSADGAGGLTRTMPQVSAGEIAGSARPGCCAAMAGPVRTAAGRFPAAARARVMASECRNGGSVNSKRGSTACIAVRQAS